jgi:hypothetical protein
VADVGASAVIAVIAVIGVMGAQKAMRLERCGRRGNDRRRAGMLSQYGTIVSVSRGEGHEFSLRQTKMIDGGWGFSGNRGAAFNDHHGGAFS